MTHETYEAVTAALQNADLETLFEAAIGDIYSLAEEDKNEYALIFNIEKDELFFLQYAIKGNGWAESAQGINPWILLGYASASDVIASDLTGWFKKNAKEKLEQHEQWERDKKLTGKVN